VDLADAMDGMSNAPRSFPLHAYLLGDALRRPPAGSAAAIRVTLVRNPSATSGMVAMGTAMPLG
jgi:hypothetical protein